jgi:glycosyltransferase involved in cell wall biosynthesis
MNVLFISNDPAIFDEQSSVRARMRAYAKEIGNLHIISQGKGPHEQHENLENNATLSLYAVRGKKPFVFLQMQRLARSIIKKENIQILSAQDPFEYGLIAARAVKGTGAKLHIQIHTDPFSRWFTNVKIVYSTQVRMPFINKIRQRIADRVIPQADGIRVVSERVKNSLAKRYGNRIPVPTVIPVVIPKDVPAPVPLPEHDFSFVLMFVGRLEPEKRIEDILRAIAQIHRDYPSVGMMIVGEGREKTKLQLYARKLGIEKNILFLGNRHDAWGLMRNATAYIQASGYEGYSRTLLEAALARIPIITTDVGIVGEVFKGYEDVLPAAPGDPSSLVAHIRGLVEDNSIRKQLADNAEKAARAHLENMHNTPKDIAEDLQKLL